jgi:hypothetical protein
LFGETSHVVPDGLAQLLVTFRFFVQPKIQTFLKKIPAIM